VYELFVWKAQGLEHRCFDQKVSIGPHSGQIRQGRLVLNQKGYTENIRFLLEGSTVLWRRRKRIQGILPLADGFVFGRGLHPEQPTVLSVRHFSLHKREKGFLLKNESRNGTYVNGCRMEETLLRDGDWIGVGEDVLYFQKGFLLCPFPTAVPSLPPTAHLKGNWKPPAIESCSRFKLEAWQISEPGAKPSLMQTCGPALMMSMGSLLSASLLGLAGSGFSSLGPSLAMSLSMSFSYLVYGLAQRHMHSRNESQKYAQAQALYLAHLEDLKGSIQAARQSASQSLEHHLQLWQTLDDSLKECHTEKFQIPAGLDTWTPVQLDVPPFSYTQRQHPLYQSVQALLEEAAKPISSIRWAKDTDAEIHTDLHVFCAYFAHSCSRASFKWTGLCPLDIPHHYDQGLAMSEGASSILGPAGRILLFHKEEKLTLADHALSKLLFPCKDLHEPLPQCQTGPDFAIPFGSGMSLHLVQDGPHGLAAGTTGSGKSEFLSHLLLELCRKNSRDWFQFILLDYKGGAFAKAFETFPHCAGIVTNLEAAQLKRLEACLDWEMQKRQAAIAAMLEKHPDYSPDIDTYNAWSNKPLSRLLLAADEFAELKTAHPEHMAFLQKTARIGRSLGIHLLLATQRPSGIVDSQIMANTGFQVCFRVQNEGESLDIVQTREAAHLSSPGQGILRTSKGLQRFFCPYTKRQLSLRPSYQIEKNGQQTMRRIEQMTYFDCVRQAMRPETGNWIVPPFEDVSFSSFLLADMPFRQTVEEISLPEGGLTLIYGGRQEAAILQSLFGTCPNVQEIKPGTVWKALETDKPFIPLFRDVRSLPDWSQSMTRIVLASRNMNWTFVPDLILAAGDEEMLFEASGRRLPPVKDGFGWMRQKETWLQCRWNPVCRQPFPHPFPDILLPRTPSQWARLLPGLCLGLKDNLPVYWNHQPICLVFDQEAMCAEFLIQCRLYGLKEGVDIFWGSQPDMQMLAGGCQSLQSCGLYGIRNAWALVQKGSIQELIPLAYV
jgi:hypothetical protein